MSNLPQNGPTRELTFGEKLVGIKFNPSGDNEIDRAKRLFAEIADMVYSNQHESSERSGLKNQLYNHTVGEILNAQMNVVKLLTLKY